MLKDGLLFTSSFFASSVEMVETLTIVLAVGLTHGWRSALSGLVAGIIVLAAVVAALGPSLVTYVPLETLQVVIGALLLTFGLQWLRKAVLRAAGLKAKHDEEQIFIRELRELSETAPVMSGAMDWTGFVVAFKAAFLEGMEVAFLVLSFGATSGRYDISVAGALSAAVALMIVGLVVHRPLRRVPENSIKFVVGLALVSFGTFWLGEGLGVVWALGDLMLFVLASAYGLAAYALIRLLQERTPIAMTGGAD